MSSTNNPDFPNVTALLKKTTHYDKDERYMATSDLCEVLKRSSGDGAATNRLDSATERQICTAVLRLLHDKSNDVQAVAVKTLGVLLTTVQQEQVLEIADSLADQVLDAAKSELRDVYTIGLRTLVKTCPSSMGHTVSQRLLGRLLDGIRNALNEEIVLACLDVLTDLLSRFGATAVSVTRQHEPVLHMCLRQLSADSPVIRKRASTTIGCLSTVLSDPLLQRMVDALLSQIDMAEGVGKEGRRKTRTMQQQQQTSTTMMMMTDTTPASTKIGDTRALIRTMCTVSGAVGHRLGQAQIDRIIPIFLRFTDPEDAITGDDEDQDEEEIQSGDDMTGGEDETSVSLANELRESCFMGFESFVLRCPVEVEPHLESIITAALAYMSYDPNYAYGTSPEDAMSDDHEEEVEMDDEENEDYDEDEEEEEDDDDDDDDESWKVRRGAIRALRAVVETKKHDPSKLWTVKYKIRRGKPMPVSQALVNRFKEREENCRVGVIDCFTRLLAVTVTAAATGQSGICFADAENMCDADMTVINLRQEYAPKIVKACEKIIAVKKGNDRSKSSALALLATLSKAPGGVGGHSEIASVFKHVNTFLAGTSTGEESLHREGSSKTLRLDALSLIHSMLASEMHDPVHIRLSLSKMLLPELCQVVQEQWYKVVAEALRALAEVPRFFVLGYTAADDETTKETERKFVASKLYASIEPLLAAHDVDQEIKECALNATASVLSYLHTSLAQEQTSRLLLLLLERLKNETTRIAAIKTISSIAIVESCCDLSPILPESIKTMSSFLRLQSRTLKQNSLTSLEMIVTNHGNNATLSDGELYVTVLEDLSRLITDKDLHLSHLSLRTAVSILKACPTTGPAIQSFILQPALKLSTSSLLQDNALESLISLFRQIVESSAIDFHQVRAMLREGLTNEIGKHGVYNLAKCIAAITATTSEENGQAVLDDNLVLLEELSTPDDTAKLRKVQLSLLVTGDLGRIIDLSLKAGVADRLKAIYIGYFESSSEDLRSAASYALGNASVGSPSVFLPAIVGKLDEENKKQQFLLLSALREYIQCSFRKSVDGQEIVRSLDVILAPLEKHCSDEEEGIRTMVAECLGSLACAQPEIVLKKLEDMQISHSEIVTTDGAVDEADIASKQNARVCWTVATSVKLAISGKVNPTPLALFMPTFVKLLSQNELHVRNAALLMVYSAVHHQQQVVTGLLKDPIIPTLYEVAALRMERKVDLGPFKHTVDDALPLRKAALSIFATLETIPGCLDMSAFIPLLVSSLSDPSEDIQLQVHQTIISMCARQSTFLVSSIDTFVEPLEKNITKKAGSKTGTELERLNDWIKSALRVTLALSKLEGAMSSQKFAEFIDRVKSNSKFSIMLTSLEEEG